MIHDYLEKDARGIMKWATLKQVQSCRALFRKTKTYYRCFADDKDLRDAVLKRTGFDLDELEAYEAQEIINLLGTVADKQRFREELE